MLDLANKPLLTPFLDKPGYTLVSNCPEGLEACILAQTISESAPSHNFFLHVCRDDVRMSRLQELMRFFAPDVEILTFPAWDCLPYDRVSPRRDILAERLFVLTRLLSRHENGQKTILITTVNSIIQRLPPKESLANQSLIIEVDAAEGQESILDFLAANGYRRTETVSEPGEYAVRGGILDLYPPHFEQPLRLDFFGDVVESIRTFDALAQTSTGKIDHAMLTPVSEVRLSDETISRFRSGYREAFGAVTKDDPLYTAISEGRPYPGMEHWLALFYEKLDTLFAYLPKDVVMSMDHQTLESMSARHSAIQDFYEARMVYKDQIHKQKNRDTVSLYQPLSPTSLYIAENKEWEAFASGHPVFHFYPFTPPQDGVSVVNAGGIRPPNLAEARQVAEGDVYMAVQNLITQQHEAGRRLVFMGFTPGSRARLATLLQEHGITALADIDSFDDFQKLSHESDAITTLAVEKGFGGNGFLFLSEQDILGERIIRKPKRKRGVENFLRDAASLMEGDYVVHDEHGIGRYNGLRTLEIDDTLHDCLEVVYHGGDKLYIPVENIDVLSRYGSSESLVELDRLGNEGWQNRKARVKGRLKDMAEQLIRIAAEREMRQVESLELPAGSYEDFAARFPYGETEDQERAIEEIIEDLNSKRPMDRLVCGDVGFGKTEVALRAAFVAAMNGEQVAVVVPTTLLARQHYDTFQKRFAGFPLRIGQLSRLVSAKDAKAVREELAKGTLDIVIGTHALLSDSVKFSHLGLLIIDEEQHFGVKQKERLKALRSDVRVLTLTATPIPRTLQLSLAGVKEMSLITTPPVDRLAVRTFVMPYDPVIIREAIMREHFRGGQIFYVCPRVHDLDKIEEELKSLVPEIRMMKAHGKLAATQLEDIMAAFVDRRFELLLSTNIVESGLDIPSANTIIIHRADMFGLAQLYQLRGRVGRSKERAYAYLTLEPGRKLTPVAERRLEVMQTLDTLGAGFTLASHDMDIRGGGNLLGEEQSGHIREVGIELYQQMLEEAVASARTQSDSSGDADSAEMPQESWTPQINLGTSVLIPEAYVPDLHVRLNLYRRLANLVDKEEIHSFAAELVDRFGELPEEVKNLLDIMEIKKLCRQAGVEKIDVGPKGAILAFHGGTFAAPDKLIQFIQKHPGKLKIRPDSKLVFQQAFTHSGEKVEGARKILQHLIKLAV